MKRGRTTLAELRLPARPEFVLVAKRTASALGSIMGFDLEGLDELNIAVAQTCESAIVAAARWLGDEATLRLTFRSTGSGIEVEVQALSGRPYSPEAQVEADWLPESHQLSMDMIRCFVDEVRYQMNSRTGSTRVRLVKYLIQR